MIDTKLIVKARQKSKEIETIDSSWRGYVELLRETIFTIPFKGNYNALIEDNGVLIEGYSGLLLIDKLYYNHKTYLLKTPVKHLPFRIYGLYDSRGRFECFMARPEIGVHYLGLHNQGHAICTGDIHYSNPDSISILREVSSKIIDSFRLINMESLGTVLLPDDYLELRAILANKETDSKTKVEKLLRENLIEEIL